MKILLVILCYILGIYAFLFPFTYFESNADKKDIRLSQILTSTETEAKKAIQELESGKAFKEIVNKYSIDDSKSLNGDLGYLQKELFDEKITKVAYNLKKNEISQPIQTEYGWHVIKVTDINYFSEPKNFKYDRYKFLKI